MLRENENKIIFLIKLGPIFVLLFAMLITYVIIDKNNDQFEEEMKKVREASLYEKKMIIKREVQRVYDFIENERKQTDIQLKNKLKKRVYEAHQIANSIYKNNTNKTSSEIKKLIKDSLRDLRFNDGRGYYYISNLDGVMISHPINPNTEGKNLINQKDKKGKLFVQEAVDIAKKSKEGYSSWWWNKPSDLKNSYEKLAFFKVFEPFDWIIGTGEYKVEHEKEVQQSIINRVDKMRYGKNGYIFIGNEAGISLSNINKEYVGKNIYNLQDSRGVYVVREIIKVAQSGEGYLIYDGIKMPSTGRTATKISYIKGIPDWKWLIGTGTYFIDLDEVINQKREKLKEKNTEQILEIFVISLILFIIIFTFSIMFATRIKSMFLEYKNKVSEKTEELNILNSNLEEKVVQRTKSLEETNEILKKTLDDLQKTKKDLISSEKMATLGELVGAVTHEVNTPLGISITSVSHLESITKNLQISYENERMDEDEFKAYIKDVEELSKIVSINLQNTNRLLGSFKSIALDQALEELRQINLSHYINEILLSMKSKLKKTKHQINIDCDNKLLLNTYPGFVSQVLINLINNSLLHAFEKDEEGTIDIIVNEIVDNKLEIVYSDNGKGISHSLQNRVFEQYFTTRKGEGGTGLGLFIIKRIIEEKLHGEISLAKKVDKGVKFIITIPKDIS